MRQRLYNLLAMGILIAITNYGLQAGHIKWAATAIADSQRLVSVYSDGQKRVFATGASTVSDVVKQAGFKVGPNDISEPSLDTVLPDTGPYNINVYRARPVVVIDGLKTYHIDSAYQSPRLLAAAAGLKLHPEDTFSTQVITNIVDASSVGEQVTVHRATPVIVKVDGRSQSIRTQSKSVAAALKNAGIAIGPQDTVSADLASPVVAGTTITITRVSEVVATLTQAIARPTQTTTDPSMLKGKTVVKDPGKDGQKTVTYRIHYRDGIETGRQVLQVVNETAPVPKVVVVGTKVFFAGSVEYWRPQVEAAAAEYGLDPNMMLRIMACESGGNATTTSRFIVNGEHPTGLFQYLPTTWRSAGGTNDNIFDGALQIKLTAKKMAREGTRAWQCQ